MYNLWDGSLQNCVALVFLLTPCFSVWKDPCVFVYMLACSYVFVVYRQLNIIALVFNLTAFVSVLQELETNAGLLLSKRPKRNMICQSKSEGCSKRIISGGSSYFF